MKYSIEENSIQKGREFLDQLSADSREFDGNELLLEVREFIQRFAAFPNAHALNAVTLWAAHTHMVENFHTTPRLALLSPEPASGKTRVLEVLDLLTPESMFCLSASPAAVFRTLSAKQVTLLVDECDTIFTKRGKDDTNEDLRALLNAGYKRGATIPRCVGPRHEVQNFAVHCSAALAGLGDLPDTIMSRSVIIRMRRRAPGERVEPFRARKHESEGRAIRDRLATWAAVVGVRAGESWPDLPDGIVDRPAEVWEPLIAVADVAGGEWPTIARDACIELCKAAEDRRVSLGIRLLGDLRTIFGDGDALHTEVILDRLSHGESYGLGADAPWNDLHGKSLGSRGLASMLKEYGVNSTKVKVEGRSLQGYRREHLWDAWTRYLPQTPAEVEPMEPAELAPYFAGFTEGSEGSGPFDDVEPAEPTQNREGKPLVPQVPEVPDLRGPETARPIGPCIPPEILAQRRELKRAVSVACWGLQTTPKEVMCKLAEEDYADVIGCPKTARSFAESVAAGMH